jgi:hypothetical protein|eukprot:COSAG02_NODE_3127_length_7316_cov_6.965360_4_plen_52_part_00
MHLRALRQTDHRISTLQQMDDERRVMIGGVAHSSSAAVLSPSEHCGGIVLV